LCKEGCGGGSICEHGKARNLCKQGCGGGSICEHGKVRSSCKEPTCGGCEHGKVRSRCKTCAPKPAREIFYDRQREANGGLSLKELAQMWQDLPALQKQSFKKEVRTHAPVACAPPTLVASGARGTDAQCLACTGKDSLGQGAHGQVADKHLRWRGRSCRLRSRAAGRGPTCRWCAAGRS